MRILLQSSVTELHEPELQLHHLEGMLHLRAHARFASVLGPLLLVDPIFVAVATMGVVLGMRRTLLDHLGLSAIGLITPYPGFFPVQQGWKITFLMLG